MNDFIPKPIDPAQLLATVRRWITWVPPVPSAGIPEVSTAAMTGPSDSPPVLGIEDARLRSGLVELTAYLENSDGAALESLERLLKLGGPPAPLDRLARLVRQFDFDAALGEARRLLGS
jgi:hypothetical protein